MRASLLIETGPRVESGSTRVLSASFKVTLTVVRAISFLPIFHGLRKACYYSTVASLTMIAMNPPWCCASTVAPSEEHSTGVTPSAALNRLGD